jgi:hypothetical protein
MKVSGRIYILATLPPKKDPLKILRTGGWVGSRAGLDAVASPGNQILAIETVAHLYTNWAILAH